MRSRLPILVAAVPILIGTWMLGARSASATLPGPPAEGLRCEVFHEMTPAELQAAMHNLVFNSLSTVTTGTTVLKVGDSAVLTGYACGW